MKFDLNSLESNPLLESGSIVVEDTSFHSLYFTKGLEYSMDIKEAYRDLVQNLYISLSEGGSDNPFVHFFNSIDDIINRFARAETDMMGDFSADLAKRASKDRYILQYKDFLLRYPEELSFTMERYRFINLDHGIPKPVHRDWYQEEYDKIDKILTDRYTTTEHKIKLLNDAYDDYLYEVSQGYYDKYRGAIIGKNHVAIRPQEFPNEIFYTFREKNKLVMVDSRDVVNTFIRFTNIKQMTETVKLDKEQTIREYNDIKRNLDNIRFDRLINTFGPDTEKLEAKFNTYIKTKVDQVVKMCDIHLLVYTGKLDALASCYMQDKTLLDMAISNARVDTKEV